MTVPRCRCKGICIVLKYFGMSYTVQIQFICDECMGLVLLKAKTFSNFFGVSVEQGDFKKELQKVG